MSCFGCPALDSSLSCLGGLASDSLLPCLGCLVLLQVLGEGIIDDAKFREEVEAMVSRDATQAELKTLQKYAFVGPHHNGKTILVILRPPPSSSPPTSQHTPLTTGARLARQPYQWVALPALPET